MDRVLWLVALVAVFFIWTSPFHQGLNPLTLTLWPVLLGIIATLGCGVVAVLYLSVNAKNYLPLVLGLLGLALALAALEPAGTQWVEWLMMALLSLPAVGFIFCFCLVSYGMGVAERTV